MKRPRPIRSRTLGVFAPASGFDPDRFERGVSVLEGLGFSVHVHPQAHLRTGYLAGDDDARAAAFFDLLDDDEVDALIAARGGYGVHRLLERLDRERDRILRAAKPIVGFSDLCALHAICQRAGLVSFHGPVVTQLGELSASDHAALVRALEGAFEGVIEADGDVIRGGVASGRLAGGCLSVLTPLVGTPYLPPLDGAILLLEDVGEAPYRIDRQLTHLRLSGVLSRVSGIAVGDFVGCKSPREGEPEVAEVLRERLGDLQVPVLTGLPFGHGTRNLTLPLGAVARLDAGARTLTIEGSP